MALQYIYIYPGSEFIAWIYTVLHLYMCLAGLFPCCCYFLYRDVHVYQYMSFSTIGSWYLISVPGYIGILFTWSKVSFLIADA